MWELEVQAGGGRRVRLGARRLVTEGLVFSHAGLEGGARTTRWSESAAWSEASAWDCSPSLNQVTYQIHCAQSSAEEGKELL